MLSPSSVTSFEDSPTSPCTIDDQVAGLTIGRRTPSPEVLRPRSPYTNTTNVPLQQQQRGRQNLPLNNAPASQRVYASPNRPLYDAINPRSPIQSASPGPLPRTPQNGQAPGQFDRDSGSTVTLGKPLPLPRGRAAVPVPGQRKPAVNAAQQQKANQLDEARAQAKAQAALRRNQIRAEHLLT